MKSMILTDEVINIAVTIVEAAEKMSAENGLTVAQSVRMMLKTMQFAQAFSTLSDKLTTTDATIQ